MPTRVVLPLLAAVLLSYAVAAHRGSRSPDAQPSISSNPDRPAVSSTSPESRRRAVPAARPRPRVVPPPAVESASVDAAVQQLSTRLREDLESLPAHAEHIACRERGADPRMCTGLLSDALYTAASRSLDPFVQDAAEGLHCDADGTRSRLQATAEADPDAALRYAALRLLTAVCNRAEDGGFPLADSVYQSLLERPAAEVQVLLDAHGRLPLQSEESRAAVVALARDADTPRQVRASALLALSHGGEDAAHLHELVQDQLDAIGRGQQVPFPRRAVSIALGACGASCGDLLRRIAGDAAPEVRELALDALTYVIDPRARDELSAELTELAAR